MSGRVRVERQTDMREVSKGRSNLGRESINPECSADVGFG